MGTGIWPTVSDPGRLDVNVQILIAVAPNRQLSLLGI